MKERERMKARERNIPADHTQYIVIYVLPLSSFPFFKGNWIEIPLKTVTLIIIMPKKKEEDFLLNHRTSVWGCCIFLLLFFSFVSVWLFLPLFFILFVPSPRSSPLVTVLFERNNTNKTKKKKKRNLPRPATIHHFFQFIACNSHQCWLANYTFFRAFVAQKAFLSLSHYMYLIWTKLTCLDYYYYYYILPYLYVWRFALETYSVCLWVSIAADQEPKLREIRWDRTFVHSWCSKFSIAPAVDTSSTKTFRVFLIVCTSIIYYYYSFLLLSLLSICTSIDFSFYFSILY